MTQIPYLTGECLLWELLCHQLNETSQNTNKNVLSLCALQHSADLKCHPEQLLCAYTNSCLFSLSDGRLPHRRAPVPTTPTLAPSVDKT